MHSKGDCKLTTIQIISSESVDDNFEQITTQLTQLPPLLKSTAHLVLLPENAICFANREHYLKSAEPLGNGPNQSRLSELALNSTTKLRVNELYLIALAIDIEPAEMLDRVCHNLKLNIN